MARKIDPTVETILKEYGFNAREVLWDCHGTWCMYHRALEQVAAKAGIVFDRPAVLENDGKSKSVALCVFGTLGERSEWSVGEASPSNCKNAYPWAMAEKRGKDRVILKLIGLHGLVYSEDEMDEQPPARSQPAPKAEPPATQPPSKRGEFIASVNVDIDQVEDDILSDQTRLNKWWEPVRNECIDYGLESAEINELKLRLIARRDALKRDKAA